MSDFDWMNGLTPQHDLMFPAQPDDPEMRESTSFWLFEENGEFALPRFGIEAEARRWDDRRVQFNMALPGGRVLNGASLSERAHSPLDVEGRPSILGAGPLRTICIEPFRKWRIEYDGEALDGTHEEQLETKLAGAKRTPVRIVADLEMAAPAWVDDSSPDRLARMTPQQRQEAEYMGIGYRIEQLFRGSGELVLGETRTFRCTGSRIHRQSVRPLGGFRGHCWQSAVFPDGRAFAYIAYPPRDDDAPSLNHGFVWLDGEWHSAQARRIPWLRDIRYEGDDVSVELESAAGTVRIGGRTLLSTFRVGNPDIGGLDLQQGSVWYEWDGQRAMGMIERSSHESLTRIVGCD